MKYVILRKKASKICIDNGVSSLKIFQGNKRQVQLFARLPIVKRSERPWFFEKNVLVEDVWRSYADVNSTTHFFRPIPITNCEKRSKIG